MTKPVVLTFVTYYLPSYKSGGPVRTIANMVELLGDELDFRIVASDRDSFETQPYPNTPLESWNWVGKAQVYYVDRRKLNLKRARRLICDTPHDVLYLNSFFADPFTQKPVLARWLGLLPRRPVVLAPRGEFSQGALAFKSLKKRLYLRLSKLFGLYRNLTWQASSAHEAAHIRKAMGRIAQEISIAPDLPSIFSWADVREPSIGTSKNDRLKIVFLARISPIKNLDFVIKILERLNIAVKFNIYGIIDKKDYWQYCQNLIKGLPSNIEVKYHGVVEHKVVPQVLSENDLYILPTIGENYGHSIIEALAAGVPALISDRTPWQDFDAAGVGWVRSLGDLPAFKKVIIDFASTDVSWRIGQRELARKYAMEVANSNEIRGQNLELFRNVCEA